VNAVLDYLRPHPHRGDVIAAGVIPLALAAISISLRMTQWSHGVRFVVTGLIAALILTMASLAPLEGETPRPYHSMLLVSGLLVLIVALLQLGRALGAGSSFSGGSGVWTFGLESLAAGYAAWRFNSGICTLIAAVAFGIAFEALINWVFGPIGIGTFRAMIVVVSAAFAAGAIRLHDRRRRHSVALVNAIGLATLVLALSLVVSALAELQTALSLASFDRATSGVGFGWKLYTLAIGFGLVAYSGVDCEPGPAYLGTGVLVLFAVSTAFPSLVGGPHSSLLGWPVFLLVLGAIGLAIGLRPRRPLPPAPVAAEGGGATVPFRVDDEA
jgi:preprotein translocase subunit SecG